MCDAREGVVLVVLCPALSGAQSLFGYLAHLASSLIWTGLRMKSREIHFKGGALLSYVVRRRWPTAQPCAAVNLRNTHALTMATSASKGLPVL